MAIQKRKTKKTRFKSILKKVKISEEIIKPKKRKWVEDSNIKSNNRVEKAPNKENISSNTKEPIKENGFHETIINEDIGFVAPVLNQNQQSIQPSLSSLESTASEFTSPITPAPENTISYTGKKTAGNYSGSVDYALGDQIKYSVDNPGLVPLGMGLDRPLSLDKPKRTSDIFNPFSEERGKRGDSNWGNQAGELEEFTKLQQKEEFEKEKKKRQSSQFA